MCKCGESTFLSYFSSIWSQKTNCQNCGRKPCQEHHPNNYDWVVNTIFKANFSPKVFLCSICVPKIVSQEVIRAGPCTVTVEP